MDAENVIKVMFLMKDRESGMNYIKDFSKSELVCICKKLDIPHNLSIKKLSDSIIENTIGFRLRSNAIQGK